MLGGIIEFVEEWKSIYDNTTNKIGGRDAYAAMICVLSECNDMFRVYIENMMDDINV